eukprot:436806-Amphidinium_carterae.1
MIASPGPGGSASPPSPPPAGRPRLRLRTCGVVVGGGGACPMAAYSCARSRGLRFVIDWRTCSTGCGTEGPPGLAAAEDATCGTWKAGAPGVVCGASGSVDRLTIFKVNGVDSCWTNTVINPDVLVLFGGGPLRQCAAWC